MQSEDSQNFLDLNQVNIHDDHSQQFQNLSNNFQRSQQNVQPDRSVRSANSRVTGRSTPMHSRRFFPSQSNQRYQRGGSQNSQIQTPANNLEMILENQQDNQSMISGDHQESKVFFWGTNIKVQEIENRFKKFIREADCPENKLRFFNNGNAMDNEDELQQQKTFKYIDKLRQICDIEKYTLQIDAEHLFYHDKYLYYPLILIPQDILPIFDIVVTEIAREQFLMADNQHKSILVSLLNLQNITKMRELSPKDIGRLIQIKGIVIRCSEIYPEMKEATFRCSQCKHEVQSQLENGRFQEPTDCVKCKQKFSFDLIHNLCLFTDKQLIKLQEMPDTVPDGETPQTITLIAYNDDLVDAVKPGDKIDVIGIYRCQPIKVTQNQRVQKSVFRTYIDVINYQKSFYQNGVNDELQKLDGDEEDKIQFTEDQEQKFFDLASDPLIYDKLVQAFAPSIWENEDVKKGILTQLFGGTQKIFSQTGKGRFRAEINILLVGDPSTAKSQLLQYVNKIAPRGIYTSGKGSSAVGLTAYVTRDVETKQIILESGALVLSDKGICCIDEFDKMDDNGRTILHEAMEQQTISVAKAGIVCQLNSRTSILASANPVDSKYNSKLSVIQNIRLPPTLLSRFDLIYLMLDNINDEKDKRLSEHILNLYGNQNNQEERVQRNVIDRLTLAKYIQYAKQQIKPKLSEEAANALIQGYTDMRQMGSHKNMITATPRQLESLIRTSEALAKMRLDPIVNENDVQEAIRLMQVATQTAVTDPTTGLIDMDMINTGHTAVEREKIQKIITYVKEIININKDRIKASGIQFNELLQATDKKFQNVEGLGTKLSLEGRELLEALKQMQEENLVQLTSHSKTPIIKLGSSFMY